MMPPVIKPKSNYDNSHWTRGETRYAPADGRKSIKAPAMLYGPWAVVREEEGTYALIHLRTNVQTVRNQSSEADACRIGDWLWKRFPLVMRLSTVEEMREKMGIPLASRVNSWLKDCGSAGKFLPPPTV